MDIIRHIYYKPKFIFASASDDESKNKIGTPELKTHLNSWDPYFQTYLFFLL